MGKVDLGKPETKTAPKEPLVLLSEGATTNAKSYAVYAVRLDLAMRFAPAKPAMADINNQAAASAITGELSASRMMRIRF